MRLSDPRVPLELRGSSLLFLSPVPWEALELCAPILRAIALEAPETGDDLVVITSTYRRPLHSSPFSWHHAAAAVDWRTGIKPEYLTVEPGAIVAQSRVEALKIAEEWADRVAERLGNEFDVVGPRDRGHVDHGHAERDGRKALRVYF